MWKRVLADISTSRSSISVLKHPSPFWQVSINSKQKIRLSIDRPQCPWSFSQNTNSHVIYRVFASKTKPKIPQVFPFSFCYSLKSLAQTFFSLSKYVLWKKSALYEYVRLDRSLQLQVYNPSFSSSQDSIFSSNLTTFRLENDPGRHNSNWFLFA